MKIYSYLYDDNGIIATSPQVTYSWEEFKAKFLRGVNGSKLLHTKVQDLSVLIKNMEKSDGK